MHKICFTVSFISCLYMFRAHVLIIRRSKLHYTASGIVTPIGGRLVHEMAYEQDQDGTAVPSWSCSQGVWHIPLLCVQWKTPDDGQSNCPKHVEFYSKNKFEKLVHLAGFIIIMFLQLIINQNKKKLQRLIIVTSSYSIIMTFFSYLLWC